MIESPFFLYVEDDPFSRQVIEVTLKRKMGFKNLMIFEDSTDFMARLLQLPEKPTVIFLDIRMEPCDGFEMLRMLRAHDDYRETTVIALTASVMNEEIDELRT